MTYYHYSRINIHFSSSNIAITRHLPCNTFFGGTRLGYVFVVFVVGWCRLMNVYLRLHQPRRQSLPGLQLLPSRFLAPAFPRAAKLFPSMKTPRIFKMTRLYILKLSFRYSINMLSYTELLAALCYAIIILVLMLYYMLNICYHASRVIKLKFSHSLVVVVIIVFIYNKLWVHFIGDT